MNNYHQALARHLVLIQKAHLKEILTHLQIPSLTVIVNLLRTLKRHLKTQMSQRSHLNHQSNLMIKVKHNLKAQAYLRRNKSKMLHPRVHSIMKTQAFQAKHQSNQRRYKMLSHLKKKKSSMSNGGKSLMSHQKKVGTNLNRITQSWKSLRKLTQMFLKAKVF